MVESKVAEGFVELTIDTATLRRGLSRAQKSITGSLRNIQRGADRAGKALSIALTAPLLAAGIASGKVAGTFETNMAKIVGLVGVAADEVDSLGNAVLELGPQVGKGPIELSEALFAITSAGKRGAEAIETLTASAKAATAGLGLTIDIADAATSATTAYAKSNLTATQAVSILVATVRSGKVEADGLASSLGQIIGISSALEIRFDEVGAAIASMSLTNRNASQVVTQFGGIIRTFLNKPSADAVKILDKAGISFAGLREEIREKGLLSALQTLKGVIGDNKDALAAIIPESEARAGFLALLGDNAERTAEIFKELANVSEDDLNKAFNAIAATGAFKFTQSLVSIQTAATQLGQVILPILAPVITKITAAIITAGNAFAELAPAMQETILTGLALGAALGPALIIFGLLVGAITTLITAFIGLGGVVLTIVGSIVGAIISIPGIIAIAAGSIFLFKDAIKESFDDIGIVIEGTFESALAKAAGFFDDFIKAIQEFDFKAFFTGLKEGIDEFGNQINKAADKFNAFVAGADKDITLGFSLDPKTIEEINAEVAELITPVADQVEDASGRIADRFAADFDSLKDNIGSVVGEIKNALGGIVDDIPGFDALVNKFPELAGKFKDSIAELNKSISSNFDETLKKLQDGIGNLETKTKSTADSIKNVLTDVSGTISSSITGVVTGATSALDALRNVANQIIGSIISSIIGAPGGGGFLGSLFGSAKGNVFSGGTPVPFADGGLISRRTTFPMVNGGVGLAGEAGNEAIFPLTRVAGGGLGISAEGVSNDNVVITQINNFQTDVRATVREEIANAAPLLINASKQATIAALNGRRV